MTITPSLANPSIRMNSPGTPFSAPLHTNYCSYSHVYISTLSVTTTNLSVTIKNFGSNTPTHDVSHMTMMFLSWMACMRPWLFFLAVVWPLMHFVLPLCPRIILLLLFQNYLPYQFIGVCWPHWQFGWVKFIRPTSKFMRQIFVQII